MPWAQPPGRACWRSAPVTCSARWDFFPPLSFQLLDLKIFVDTDSDIRLVRRLRRDISERGRDIEGVIKQYNKFVKPAFDQYIQPTMRLADIVVPRGTATCLGPERDLGDAVPLPSALPLAGEDRRVAVPWQSEGFCRRASPDTGQKQVPGEFVLLFPQLVLPYKHL